MPGVQQLARNEPRCGQHEIGIAIEERRRLAAKLERHWREILGRRASDRASDRGRARKEQVIERQPGEGLTDVCVAKHHREFFIRKFAADQLV